MPLPVLTHKKEASLKNEERNIPRSSQFYANTHKGKLPILPQCLSVRLEISTILTLKSSNYFPQMIKDLSKYTSCVLFGDAPSDSEGQSPRFSKAQRDSHAICFSRQRECGNHSLHPCSWRCHPCDTRINPPEG